MTDINDGDVRTRIAKALPDLMTKALNDYQKFAKQGKKKNETAKEFKARHDAGKAAVAHMKMIVGLAGDVAPDAAADGNQQEIIRALLVEAQDELEKQEGESE